MLEAVYLSLAALLSLVGMAWLALAMDVHWAQARQIALAESRPPQRLLRTLGGAALLSSFVVCLLADRPSIAVLVWVMLATGAAFVVAWILSRSPSFLRLCWPAA